MCPSSQCVSLLELNMSRFRKMAVTIVVGILSIGTFQAAADVYWCWNACTTTTSNCNGAESCLNTGDSCGEKVDVDANEGCNTSIGNDYCGTIIQVRVRCKITFQCACSLSVPPEGESPVWLCTADTEHPQPTYNTISTSLGCAYTEA